MCDSFPTCCWAPAASGAARHPAARATMSGTRLSFICPSRFHFTGAHNVRGHRPEREQRERPVRWTAKFDARLTIAASRSCLLYDLIRPPQEQPGDRQAERLRPLEIDHQLELRGLLDGKIRGLGALEDFGNIDRGLSRHLDPVRS